MKILNLMKILLLCVMTAGLASCGDDNYYTIQNSDEKLCSDSWVEEYDTEEGACRHILEFTKGKQGGKEVLSGKETFIVTTTGNTKTDTHDFTWKWIDNSREGLILNYGSGDVKIFENVWVREHYLSGKLDGEIMMLLLPGIWLIRIGNEKDEKVFEHIVPVHAGLGPEFVRTGRR